MTQESTNTANEVRDNFEIVYAEIMARYEVHEKTAERYMGYLEEDYLRYYSQYAEPLYKHKYMMQLLKDVVSKINSETDVDDYNAEFHFRNVFDELIERVGRWLRNPNNIRAKSNNQVHNECTTIEYASKVEMLHLLTAWSTLLHSECNEDAIRTYRLTIQHLN